MYFVFVWITIVFALIVASAFLLQPPICRYGHSRCVLLYRIYFLRICVFVLITIVFASYELYTQIQMCISTIAQLCTFRLEEKSNVTKNSQKLKCSVAHCMTMCNVMQGTLRLTMCM